MLCSLTKTVLAFVVTLLVTNSALYAQDKLPFDSGTGKISYKFSIELDKSFKKRTVYALVQDWFNQQPELFSRSNTVDTVKSVVVDKKRNENKEAVQREFANLSPLQHTDPESDRLSGKVILKYTGTNNGCIRLFYVQYAIILIVQDNKLTGEICNIRYNHFNPRTYLSQPVFNWSGMMPCDDVNTLEYLKDCEACHVEFSTFYSFLNKDTNELINSLRDFMKANKTLTLNSTPN